MILRNLQGEPAALEDLQYWAADLGLDFPVLSDADGLVERWYDPFAQEKYTVLIDRGMVLHTVGDADIPDALARLDAR